MKLVEPVNLPDVSYSYDPMRAAAALDLGYNVWPEAMEWAAKTASWCPLYCTELTDDGVGCCCGSYDGYRIVWSTTNTPAGAIEGILHEAGHFAVRDVGINLEFWSGDALLNDPNDLYESPIRKDKLRPIGAVFHAQYSYLWVLEWYMRLGTCPDRVAEIHAKLLDGHEVLKAIRPAPKTRDFIEGAMEWSRRLLYGTDHGAASTCHDTHGVEHIARPRALGADPAGDQHAVADGGAEPCGLWDPGMHPPAVGSVAVPGVAPVGVSERAARQDHEDGSEV